MFISITNKNKNVFFIKTFSYILFVSNLPKKGERDDS